MERRRTRVSDSFRRKGQRGELEVKKRKAVISGTGGAEAGVRAGVSALINADQDVCRQPRDRNE